MIRVRLMWTCPNCKTMQGEVIEERAGSSLVECVNRGAACADQQFVLTWQAKVKVDFTLHELVEVAVEVATE